MAYNERVSIDLPKLSNMQGSCAVLYCPLRPVRLYHIFPHYLVHGMIYRKKLLYMKCVF